MKSSGFFKIFNQGLIPFSLTVLASLSALFLLGGFVAFVSACQKEPVVQASEYLDPDLCKAKDRETCDSSQSCEDICYRLFSRREDTRDCFLLPRELVENFDDLILSTQDGDIDAIDIETLACFVGIDEREFARAVQRMDQDDARRLLIFIMEDAQLANILRNEDETYGVLEQIFHKIIHSKDLHKILTEKIEGKKTVLWLSAEQDSDPAFNYLDGYVSYRCDTNRRNCPGMKPIGAYCKALLEMKDSHLSNFLSSADIFASEYQAEALDDGYEWKARDRREGDFRTYCEGKLSSTCPERHPPESKLLADIQFEGGEYISPDHRDRRSRESSCTDPPDKGVSSPESGILLKLSSTQAFLNMDAVNDDQGKTYYLYVDGVRYNMRDLSRDRSACPNGIRRVELRVNLPSNLLNNRELEVHIASEDRGECEFYD